VRRRWSAYSACALNAFAVASACSAAVSAHRPSGVTPAVIAVAAVPSQPLPASAIAPDRLASMYWIRNQVACQRPSARRDAAPASPVLTRPTISAWV
jgi:hypothetical protein